MIGSPTKVLLLASILTLVVSNTSALAQDTAEERRAAALRYMNVMPMSKMLNDSISELAKQVPDDKRAAFISHMHGVLRVDILEQTALNAMVKIFTTEELNAVADFYGSKAGRSATAKFGIYVGEIMPVLQQEIHRAIQQQEGRK